MLRKIYNFIDDYVRDNMVLYTICFIVGTILMIFAITRIFDYTPATDIDYMPLIEQKDIIIQDFSAIYTYDNYLISPNEDSINVELENEQCKIICTFDKSLHCTDYAKIDSAVSIPSLIFACVFFGVIAGGGIFTGLFAIFVPFLLSWLFKFLEWICLLLVGRKN